MEFVGKLSKQAKKDVDKINVIVVYAGRLNVGFFSVSVKYFFYHLLFNAKPANKSTPYFTHEAISTRYVRFLIHISGIF